jgi:tetratricopeptide (TPR) repeat protein
MRLLTAKTLKNGKKHPDTLSTLETIANLYLHDGKFEEAREAFVKALTVRESTFGKVHPVTLNIYNRLGKIEERMNNFSRAETLYQNLLTGTLSIMGTSHFRVYQIRDKVISLKALNGESSQSIFENYDTLFKESESALTIDDPVTMTIAHHLADSLVALKRYKEAAVYYRKSYSGRCVVLGENHIFTLLSQHGLAICLSNLKNFKEAYDIFKELITRFDNHPNEGREGSKTIATIQSCVDICKISGDKELSETLMRRLVEYYQKNLGHDHPTTLDMIATLAKSYQS